MASYKKEASGWRVKFDLGKKPDGSRNTIFRRGFATKKEAEEFYLKEKASFVNGTYVDPSKQTFAEYLDYWYEHYAIDNVVTSTLESYRSIIETHLKPELGSIVLQDLKPKHLQTYYKGRMKSGKTDGSGGLAARTVLHHHRLISEALKHAVGWEMISRNVANAVKPPSPDDVEMVALTEEHEEIFFEVARQYQVEESLTLTDYFSIFFIDTNTGLRQGELLALKWPDFDLSSDEPTVTIQRSLQRQQGKGLVFKEPKTKKSRRTIPIMGFVVDYLKKLRVRQLEHKLQMGPAYQDNGLVFAQYDGRPVEPTEVRRKFQIIAKRAAAEVERRRKEGEQIDPFPAHIRFHDLRHTWATRAIQSGMDIKLVSEILGHSTIYITLSTYHHLLPKAKVSAIAQLESKKGYAQKYTL